MEQENTLPELSLSKEQKQQAYTDALEMGFQSVAFQRKSILYQAGALYNIWAAKLFTCERGVKTMNDFCKKFDIARSQAYKLINAGKRMATTMQQAPGKFDGILRRSHIEIFADADATLLKLETRNTLLLTDGGVSFMPNEPVEDNADLDGITFEAVDPGLVGTEVLRLANEKANANRKPKKGKQALRAAKEETYNLALSGAIRGAEQSHAAWHNLGGFTQSQTTHLQYYARLIQYYAEFTPRDLKSDPMPFVTYEEAETLLTDGALSSATNPAVFFAVTGKRK